MIDEQSGDDAAKEAKALANLIAKGDMIALTFVPVKKRSMGIWREEKTDESSSHSP